MTWPVINEIEMVSFLLILFRCAAFISVFPAFGNGTVPRRVKLGVAASIGFLLSSNVPHLTTVPEHWMHLALFALRETMLGLLMGSLLRFAFMGQVYRTDTYPYNCPSYRCIKNESQRKMLSRRRIIL